MLRLVPGVVDAAVVGVPDERLGEVPVACIVIDREVDDAVLEAECREHLVAYKVPVAYRRVVSLPRNDVGKLQRRVVAASIREEGTS